MYCQFCEKVFERNKEQGLPEKESIVYEDDNIYVMPDICPLTVGHLLIISKKHYQGYASAQKDTIKSVEEFLVYYKKRIGNRNYTLFEHGAVIAYNAGASIDHAHFHIVPFEINMIPKLNSILGDDFKYSLSELSELASRKQPYLFFKNGNDEKGHVYKVGKIESQFLRNIANQMMKRKQDYDWKRSYQKGEAYIEFCKTLAWWKSLDYSVTFKWKKKLVLEKYGLVEYKELLEDTNRFKIEKYDLLIKILEKELEISTEEYHRIVLVPVSHHYKLPNYVISGKEDISGLDNFIRNHIGYKEIWYFNGRKEKFNNSYSGRISYNWVDYNLMEIIEMVSGDSPRQIEKYTIKEKKVDYLRLVRKDRELEYQLEDVQVGVNYKNRTEWMNKFIYLEQILETYHTQLCLFKNMVRQYGINSMSLEFRVLEGKLSFIDWDTSDDERILKNESV